MSKRSSQAQSAERLLQLIESVYAAALDEERWEGLAPQFAAAFGSTSTTLQIQRSGGQSQILSVTDNVNAHMGEYKAHYWQRDIWVDRAVKRIGMSQVGCSGDLVSDGEFAESEFYRDWCRHVEVFYVIGAVFPSGDGSLGVLGVHRPRTAGHYDSQDKVNVARFLPHLERALRVRDQLRHASAAKQISLTQLDRCNTASLLVSGDGQILYTNAGAEELLQAGTILRSKKGQLLATDAADGPRLAALIRCASVAGGGVQRMEASLALHHKGTVALSVLAIPFSVGSSFFPADTALLMIRSPWRAVRATGSLRRLFGFTYTEARVAQAMMNGSSIAQIAHNHRASVQTVRKQVKSVLEKTGTGRQAECVAHLLRTVAPLSRD